MFKSIIKPTLVLSLICVVISALLSATYNLAGVEALAKAGLKQEVLDEVMPEVLPGATSLKSVTTSLENANVLGIYQDESGVGTAIYLTVKGYGGDIKILIGIHADGTIAGAKAIENMETTNLGTRALEPSFFQKFVGKNENFKVEKSGGNIDAIAGSTISSKAVGNAMNLALSAYEQIKGELAQ